MLETVARKSDKFVSLNFIGNALLIKTEAGLIRIKPQNDSIIRFSYTKKEEFEDVLGDGIVCDYDFTDWKYSETETETIVSLSKLSVIINKSTGSIRYENENGKLLLSETAYFSRNLGQFDSFRTVIDENTKIEEIDTPDGKKRNIVEASKIFDKKIYKTRLNLKFQDDEQIYGFGQAEEGSLNLRGTRQYVHQANLKIAIPMMLSTMGYGILFATSSTMIFSDNEYGTYIYTEACDFMDFYFIAGEKLDDVVKGYRYLSGTAVMLPRWAFGFMQSQERYETQEEVLGIEQGYRERNLGLDSIVMDWRSWKGEEWGQKSFDFERFPDPKLMTDTLHENNVKFMISIWPNMRYHTDNYKEFEKADLLLPANEIYDAFNPEARKLYWKQANEGLFKYGIDAWWCDSSEPFVPEWQKNIRFDSANMYNDFVNVASKFVPIDKINAFSLYHAQTISEGQRAVCDEKRIMNLTRSTYTGGQKNGIVLWSGDTYASWETFQKQIPAGLNFCASGLPYWTLDIGAFFVKSGERWFRESIYETGLDDLGYRELFVRWFQYGAFLPIFRSHGTDVRREMWLFDGENHMFYDALVKANKLRYTLIPYIYSLAGKVYLEDYTMMRMLAFDFANDPMALKQKEEFMFGDSILVCPVTKPMYYEVNSQVLENINKTQDVYLPSSCDWFDYYTNEKHSGGQTITVDAPLDKMPLFVKAGSIIPMTAPLLHTSEVENAQITIHVYAGADCEFTMYEDSGDGYAYEKGDYKLTKFSWNDKEHKLNISENSDRFEIVIHE